MKRWKKVLIGFGATLAALGVAGYVIYGGGEHEGPGTIRGAALPAAAVQARAERQRVAGAPPTRQILFGDLHVHTTFSMDAFLRSLPIMGGDGAHPPADACDFARYCSALDFFALTDHAESLTPEHWRESIESIRQCNAVAGDPADPDLVAYVGWEWSHVGQVPEEHYGHKNVIFRDLGDDDLPARPIGAGGLASDAFRADPGLSLWTLATIPIREFSRRQRYLDLAHFTREIKSMRDCSEAANTRDLPSDCRELASTPATLFEKLDQWGLDALVIPHGSSWGFYTPPGYSWDKQLTAAQRSARYQNLIEVYSGHGNSEEYRPWRAVEPAGDGFACPAPVDGHETCCWRAGEIIRSRCPDPTSAACEAAVVEARRAYANAGAAGRVTIPGTTTEDWRDCGQCRDCFQPAFNYRPAGAAQYILARGNFDDPNAPHHERFGFIASSDNHSARPGTGYKEHARVDMTDTAGPRSQAWRDRLFGAPERPSPSSRSYTPEQLLELPPFRLVDVERQASFFMTGGLVAVHSDGRDRNAIWSALERREVYGTSGPRILLWFDAIAADGSSSPMGSQLTASAAPRFSVRAAGSFEQKPGCPADTAGLAPERLASLCAGECYHPGDRRHAIRRIEIIRIRPQTRADEPIAPLIEDPWKTLPCPPGQAMCTVEFEDPDFVAGQRSAVYYARAVQEPTEAINAGGLRCKDAACTELDVCYGSYRTDRDDDCLSATEQRAWSSPIFVDWAPPPTAVDAGVSP